jgi:hypothetical protein
MKKIILLTVWLVFLVWSISSAQVIATKPYGYNSIVVKDTTLVTTHFVTITIGANNVSGIVTILPTAASTTADTIFVGFNGDTLSTQQSIVTGDVLARQFYRRVKTIHLKGNSALTVRVELEY